MLFRTNFAISTSQAGCVLSVTLQLTPSAGTSISAPPDTMLEVDRMGQMDNEYCNGGEGGGGVKGGGGLSGGSDEKKTVKSGNDIGTGIYLLLTSRKIFV